MSLPGLDYFLSSRRYKPSGTLCDTQIVELIDSNAILVNDTRGVQPASIDLSLSSSVISCTRASFLPGSIGMHQMLRELRYNVLPTNGSVLEPGKFYVARLHESLKLPRGISGTANPKSSTGRIDLFVRLLTYHGDKFDVVPAGYEGSLFLEISPRSFPVRIHEGASLVQLRLRYSHESVSTSTLVGTWTDIVDRLPTIDDGLVMHVDLKGEDGNIVGYRAKRYAPVINLGLRNHVVTDFWEPIYCCDRLILEPDVFYILASKERVAIPSEYAAEMVPMDANIGEFRVHYAGFFDPGFGQSPDGPSARAVLEVRARDVPFVIYDGQPIARMLFERTSKVPEKLYGDAGNNYQSQGLKLSKHFGG